MKRLFVEQTTDRVTVALTNNDRLQEIYIDKAQDISLVGNIVVGRIRTIMPGQFAFVDIGDSKNAFMNLKTGHELKSGQPVLVQVQKDAVGSKGAYVSQEITLKGWLVILHKTPEVGVSHKITDEKESRRLKQLVRKLLPKGYGAIVRTNAEGQSREDIALEINKLHEIFEDITKKAAYAMPPVQLYPGVSAQVEPLLNDLLSEAIDEILLSGIDEFCAGVKACIANLPTDFSARVACYKEKILDSGSIKKQIKTALEKNVPLPCGGFITIEETEACVVVDVNTGNNASNHYYRETVLNTNLEAAAAIIDQIILRNLSGIIVIDFIDMTKQEDKTKLMSVLAAEAKRDRLNPEIVGLSKFGIAQIARPKRRLPLSHVLEEKCQTCGGKGRVLPHKNMPKA